MLFSLTETDHHSNVVSSRLPALCRRGVCAPRGVWCGERVSPPRVCVPPPPRAPAPHPHGGGRRSTPLPRTPRSTPRGGGRRQGKGAQRSHRDRHHGRRRAGRGTGMGVVHSHALSFFLFLSRFYSFMTLFSLVFSL